MYVFSSNVGTIYILTAFTLVGPNKNVFTEICNYISLQVDLIHLNSFMCVLMLVFSLTELSPFDTEQLLHYDIWNG